MSNSALEQFNCQEAAARGRGAGSNSATAEHRGARERGHAAGWRRGRDSNPRYGYPYAAFRVRCFQPLSHLSVAAEGATILSVGGYVSNARRLNKSAATLSPSHPMIRSAISRLFLSIISMWLLPLWPASGSSRNLAEPPADLMALTVAAQPLRRSSPFGPGAPWLLSPHTDSSGTLE